MRGVADEGQITADALDRAVRALRDFTAIAASAGAQQVIAVATAAVREAENRAEFAQRVREEVGIQVEIIDGKREAEVAFVGAISNLPVEHAMLTDIGGGSVQLVHARDRRIVRSWTIPLGSLRLSNRFLRSDPPTPREIAELRRHVIDVVSGEQVPQLSEDEHLVATGGTARNLARIDREAHHYPIARVHGYTLKAGRLAAIVELVCKLRAVKRKRIPGLDGERVDSIVGGALVAETLMGYIGATELQVSAQGLREGLAHSMLTSTLPSVATVRAASVANLARRFAIWDQATAERRTAIATALLCAVLPGPSSEVCDTVSYGAQLIDIGRSIDFCRRHRHAEGIVRAADLAGFSHRQVAMLAATLGQAAARKPHRRRCAPLVGHEDQPMIALSAAVLAAAEDVERRCAPEVPLDIRARRDRDAIELQVATFLGGDLSATSNRFRKATQYGLSIAPATPNTSAAAGNSCE
jgi:exopolyphosphatase/guanosine-5'-triphosphate,3'-diphosphate pyrophosphatase